MTGFFDLLNSGHVAFLKEAAEHGDLYVGVGSDRTFRELKGRAPVCSEQERLYMVKAVRYVKDAFINTGSGILDFLEVMDRVRPDILVVNSDGGSDLKRKACAERGVMYASIGAEADTDPKDPIPGEAPILRSKLPYRIDIPPRSMNSYVGSIEAVIAQPAPCSETYGWSIHVPAMSIR